MHKYTKYVRNGKVQARKWRLYAISDIDIQ